MCLAEGAELAKALSRAQMFLPPELNRRLHQFRRDLHDVLIEHVGPQRPQIADERSLALLEIHVHVAKEVAPQI